VGQNVNFNIKYCNFDAIFSCLRRVEPAITNEYNYQYSHMMAHFMGVVENAVFVIPASAIGRISLWLKGGDPVISIGSGFLRKQE